MFCRFSGVWVAICKLLARSENSRGLVLRLRGGRGAMAAEVSSVRFQSRVRRCQVDRQSLRCWREAASIPSVAELLGCWTSTTSLSQVA